MGINERQAYLKAIRVRYWRARKKIKVTILDEFCAVCGYNRKYAIRLLNQRAQARKKRRPGRKPIYASPELLSALKRIWFASDQMCSKKLKAAIPLWLPYYETVYKRLTPETQERLLSGSAATIDRLLKPVRVTHGRKGLCGTRPGSLLKNQIPIRTHFWDVSQPGFMEADTVAHCGNSLAGSFIWSLTMTDIHTTWTENRATWDKGAQGVLAPSLTGAIYLNKLLTNLPLIYPEFPQNGHCQQQICALHARGFPVTSTQARKPCLPLQLADPNCEPSGSSFFHHY